ncbi:unnamed protein product, partial [Diamesa tonsa]
MNILHRCKLARILFGKSSIHGFSYIVNQDLLFIEQIFWILSILSCIYGTYFAFSGQLMRYDENPTVLSLEILSQGIFNRPSFTVCTNFTNEETASKIVKNLWNMSNDSEKYSEYLEFVKYVSRANYRNLNEFKNFANNPDFDKVDLLQIATEMKTETPVSSTTFTNVITELGICQSSTKLYRFQNPFFKEKKIIAPKENQSTCSSLKVCRTSVSPNVLDLSSVDTIYIHNEEEVTSGDDSMFEVLSGSLIIEVTLRLDEIIAHDELYDLKPKSRKCLFYNEPQSKYFDAYTPNLCKISCRIKKVLRLCGCVPFFYPIVGLKVCSPKEHGCLSNITKWYDVNDECQCQNLCEQVILTRVASNAQDLSFDRLLTVDMVFPKTRIKRSVLFAFDDLVVGFGGAAALFLGFSFLSGVELFYFTIEF